jgi:hypothetical protein
MDAVSATIATGGQSLTQLKIEVDTNIIISKLI